MIKPTKPATLSRAALDALINARALKLCEQEPGLQEVHARVRVRSNDPEVRRLLLALVPGVDGLPPSEQEDPKAQLRPSSTVGDVGAGTKAEELYRQIQIAAELAYPSIGDPIARLKKWREGPGAKKWAEYARARGEVASK